MKSGYTVQYTVEPLLRYVVKRTTTNEEMSVEEQVALVSTIDDARQTAKALTEHARRHPEDASLTVLDFGDAEIH